MRGREAYLQTHVLSADPVELVCLLYQHAADSVREARASLARGDIGARAKAISKAIGILGELNGALDRKVGGTISTSLEQLYSYMTLRLTEANVRQQDAPLAEVESLMNTLGQAWQETRARQSAAAAHVTAPPPAAWQESNLDPAVRAWSA